MLMCRFLKIAITGLDRFAIESGKSAANYKKRCKKDKYKATDCSLLLKYVTTDVIKWKQTKEQKAKFAIILDFRIKTVFIVSTLPDPKVNLSKLRVNL